MALKDLLNLAKDQKKIGISEERIEAIVPVARQYLAYWREYPDMFVDFLVRGWREETKDGEFKFYFYQRVFLRAIFRHQYCYMVYPRAYSKSFLSILALMIRCILYPRAELFVTSGGKAQAAGILKSKVTELCTLIPSLRREIDWRRGKTLEGKDYCLYVFRNGSKLDVVAARESSRGLRRHGGLVEECVGVDGQILQEVIIPTMAVDRRCMDGSRIREETLNKSQVYVTTAGYKNTFPYEKLIGFLVRMLIQPERCIILGGTWRLPVAVGLQPKTFIQDQRDEGTFNEASFEREYESKWTGTVEGAFYDGDKIDRNRILQRPEYEPSGRSNKNAYYIISVDVGRKGCQSVACVFKVTPQPQGRALKNLVNIFTYDDMHFQDQAIKLKDLYFKYKARRLVIDGNGLGIGLLDYMVKSQDTTDGCHYCDFGVYNDDEGFYKKYRTNETEDDAIYVIKANAPINTEMYTIVQSNIDSGHIKFLIEEKLAKAKLLGTKVGQAMSPEERGEFLMPFTLTSILKEEMTNLREENEGVNIILKQASKKIKKDKFSAFGYGLYYIKQEEDRVKKRKRFVAADWKFYN